MNAVGVFTAEEMADEMSSGFNRAEKPPPSQASEGTCQGEVRSRESQLQGGFNHTYGDTRSRGEKRRKLEAVQSHL